MSDGDLLAEAFTDPGSVIARAERLLPSASGAERCEVLRALGNACRELRRTTEAIGHHEAALALASLLGDARLEGLSAMSLSATLTYDGEFDRAVELAGRSVALLDGEDRLTALNQRAGILQRAGRHDEALAAFDALELELASTTAVSDPSLEWDLLTNRGVLYGLLGDIDAAEADTRKAMASFTAVGWHKRAADAQHNLAWLAGRRGDIVEALRHFELAEAGYRRAEVPALSIFPDRCETLLAAGLAGEALDLAERSASNLASVGDHVDRAEALLLVARSAVASGRYERAMAAAEEASSLFSAQDRLGWSLTAEYLAIEARLFSECVGQSDLNGALRIAETADDAGFHEVGVDARLLAAEIAVALGDWNSCRSAIDGFDEMPFGLAARFRMELVRARLAEATGERRLAAARCIAALDEFAELAAALGGTDMRANIAVHVERLAALGLRLALEDGDPESVLVWAERHRATALAPPPVQPPDDADLEQDLNELRSALLLLDEIGRSGRADSAAEDRVASGQERVRRRLQRAPGGLGGRVPDASVVRDLGRAGAAWAVFVQSQGRQFAVYTTAADVELVDLGAVEEVDRAAARLTGSVSLHMSALGRGAERDPAGILDAAERLDTLLFPRVDRVAERVVVCPEGATYGLPWGLLPSLKDRQFVLTPSVTAYRRCREIGRETTGRVVAVAGPRLAFAEHEAEQVMSAHGGATVLAGRAADADHVKRALAGADIAHFACHGHFEPESPMFSSLELHGGPMFVHEFERLRPCPRVTVLSACHAGSHASPTAGEILGLSASLVAAGARSVVAATFAVPDSAATAAVMRAIHDSLAAGCDVAQALRAAREVDPVLGGAFVCHGAP